MLMDDELRRDLARRIEKTILEHGVPTDLRHRLALVDALLDGDSPFRVSRREAGEPQLPSDMTPERVRILANALEAAGYDGDLPRTARRWADELGASAVVGEAREPAPRVNDDLVSALRSCERLLRDEHGGAGTASRETVRSVLLSWADYFAAGSVLVPPAAPAESSAEEPHTHTWRCTGCAARMVDYDNLISQLESAEVARVGVPPETETLDE